MRHLFLGAAWIKEAERDEQPGALSADERAKLVRLREERVVGALALGWVGQ